jgi:hypothetical protein
MSSIVAGTGLAVGGTADNAALEASLQALERGRTDRADLALVFMTGDDAWPRTHEALHAVRRVTGARGVVGCSGAGVLTERREVEGEPGVAVMAIRGERLVATPFLLARQGEREDIGAGLAQRVGPTLAEGGWVSRRASGVGRETRQPRASSAISSMASSWSVETVRPVMPQSAQAR